MLFRSRQTSTWPQRARTWFWPRRSFARSARYFAKRVLRLSAAPHAIAAGVAAGVFASFLPFPGTHFLIAAAAAWIIRGSMVAAILGTAVGNPLTLPLMWGSSYELGRYLLYGTSTDSPSPRIGELLRTFDIADLWAPFLKPAAIGALPLGLAAGLAFYVITRWSISAFREQRRQRLMANGRIEVAGRGEAASP